MDYSRREQRFYRCPWRIRKSSQKTEWRGQSCEMSHRATVQSMIHLLILAVLSLLKSPQGSERLVIFAGGSYRHGYGGDSLCRCFDLRLPLSWPRLAGT